MSRKKSNAAQVKEALVELLDEQYLTGVEVYQSYLRDAEELRFRLKRELSVVTEDARLDQLTKQFIELGKMITSVLREGRQQEAKYDQGGASNEELVALLTPYLVRAGWKPPRIEADYWIDQRVDNSPREVYELPPGLEPGNE